MNVFNEGLTRTATAFSFLNQRGTQGFESSLRRYFNFVFVFPAGALTECYDELGNRYQLPVYCLSPPVNMIEERSDEPDGSDPDSVTADPSTGSAGDPVPGGECQLRLRLSTGRDLRLAVRSTDTVGMMKRRLQSQEGVLASTQRWFFSGRPLTDRLRLDQLNISRDYVVQVILSQRPPPEPGTPPGRTAEACGPAAVEGGSALSEEPATVENWIWSYYHGLGRVEEEEEEECGTKQN